MKINFIDLQRQYQHAKLQIDLAIQKTIDDARFIMGPQIRELEQRLADFVGCEHAVGCASGTEALLLALMTLGIKSDDEIITTPFTFIASAETCAFLGGRPVFADIDLATFNLDPTRIEAAVTPKTKGIIAVDLFGQCADYDAIHAIAERHGLFVIEDAAQAFGAEYKDRKACALAQIACTSFFPAKPLGCYGDGGMLFTSDPEMAERVRSLINHGKGKHKYEHIRIGLNGRLDNLQAAILLAKFDLYPREIVRRNEKAAYYDRHLTSNVIKPKIAAYNHSVWSQYTIRAERRDILRDLLASREIPTAVHYPKPLHLQPCFRSLGYKAGDFPAAERAAQQVLSIPLHPYLETSEQDSIIESINSFYEKG